MNRRAFFRFSSKAAVAVPLMTLHEVARLGKPTPTPLPKLEAGQILTADVMNDLFNRVNRLEDAQ